VRGTILNRPDRHLGEKRESLVQVPSSPHTSSPSGSFSFQVFSRQSRHPACLRNRPNHTHHLHRRHRLLLLRVERFRVRFALSETHFSSLSLSLSLSLSFSLSISLSLIEHSSRIFLKAPPTHDPLDKARRLEVLVVDLHALICKAKPYRVNVYLFPTNESYL